MASLGFRLRPLTLSVLVALIALAFTGTARMASSQPQSSVVEVTSVDTSGYPEVNLTVVSREEIPRPDTVAITEDGARRSVMVTALSDTPLEVVVVLDMSGTVDDQMRPAIAAVAQFALRLPAEAEVGLVTGGGEPRAVIAPTRDVGALLSALADAEAGGAPSLLEAVPLALEQLSPEPSERGGRRAVVVLAGGANEGEPSEVENLAKGLRDEGVSLFLVSIPGDVAEELVAAGVGAVERIDALSHVSSALDRVANDLDNLYRLNFEAEGVGPTEVGVVIGDGAAAQTTLAVNLPFAESNASAAESAGRMNETGAGPSGSRIGWLWWTTFAAGGALLLIMAMALDSRRAGAWSLLGRFPPARRRRTRAHRVDSDVGRRSHGTGLRFLISFDGLRRKTGSS